MVSKKLGLVKRKLIFLLALIAMFALFLGAAAPQLRAYQAGGIQFEEVEFFIEVNATDGDAGVQLFLDGEQWRNLMMFDPDGNKLLDVTTGDSLTIQGLTEFFFESAEPSFEVVSLEEFLDRFPEGEYTFVGETIDGERIEGSATFTHVIPAGPVIISPEEEEAVEADDVEIEWEPVTSPAGVEIISYEVIVESDDASGEFRVILPPTATSVEVPEEIFDPEVTEYSFEILAKEISGNQTITESEFDIVFEDEDDEDNGDDEDVDDEDVDDEDADEGDDDYDGPSFHGTVRSITESSIRLTRGIGFIIDEDTVIEGSPVIGSEVEVQFRISRGRFIAVRISEVAADASVDSDGELEEDEDSDEDASSEEEGEEGEEEDIIGVVESLSDSELVFEDGTTFEINDDTDFEVSVRVGMRIEVEAMRSGGRLIAVEIDRP